ADDARQNRQERLKVITGQGLNVHLGAPQDIADGNRLETLGRRVRGDDDFHALAYERQTHLDEDLLGLAWADAEGCRGGIGESLAGGVDQITSRRHVGERHLTDDVAGRLPDDDIPIDTPQFDRDGRYANALDDDRDAEASRPRA